MRRARLAWTSRWAWAAAAVALAFGPGGCAAGKTTSKSPPGGDLVASPVPTVGPAVEPGGLPRGARAHSIAAVPRKAMGPFFGRASFGALAAWIGPVDRGAGQQLEIVPLGQDGAPFGPARTAAKVPQEATSLLVRPAGTKRSGWLVAWSALLDRGESLSVLGIAPDGSPVPSPYDVQRTNDHIRWADIVPLASGGMCVWAEETTGGDANILVAPVDGDGKPRGLPVRVARGVVGWSVAPDGEGVALALVSPGVPGSGGPGTLSWVRVDGDGRARAAPIPIGVRATVSGEVDVARVDSAWVLAWTDRTGEDAQVQLASVDDAGRVTGPHPAMESVGGASLVGLRAGPAGAMLAWAEPRGRMRPMRPLHLASVTLDGPTARPVTSLDLATSGRPELVATDHGFAILSPAAICAVDDGPLCKGGVGPMFVRLDARLQPTQAEPLLLSGVPAALGWDLRCLEDTCVALAANGAAPTEIFTIDLAPRESGYRVPITPPLPRDAPRVTGVVTVASGQPYTDVATLRNGETTLVATLSAVTDAPPTRKDRGRGPGASIALRPFGAQGQPLGPAATITARALPVGGLALAPAGRPEDGAVLAWVARDDGDPQVHLARLDRRGHRTNEVQLTTAKGDASDVAVAWAGDGWLVAWVDARDGNGEVYATRVDLELQRTAREERLTRAQGDAGDVALLVRGEHAWVAWSDPRESPREGLADVYAMALRPRDARPAGDETRVLPTAGHSRSPELVAAGDGALVAWIEDAPQGVEAHGTAMVARLDPGARVVGPPQALALAEAGEPNALALQADGDGARVFVARSLRTDVAIDALALRADGSAASPAWRLLDLDAPGTFDVVLSPAGDGLYFDDVGVSAYDHRIRRATIAWRR